MFALLYSFISNINVIPPAHSQSIYLTTGSHVLWDSHVLFLGYYHTLSQWRDLGPADPAVQGGGGGGGGRIRGFCH